MCLWLHLSVSGCSTCFGPIHAHIHTNPVACALLQVDVLVSYGLTYSFPIEDEETGAGGVPRAAPLAPSIDTLHAYSALSQPVARFLGDRRALKPGWAKGVPLTMRQMLAQRISTAVITRLEQVRMHCVQGGRLRLVPMVAQLRVPVACNLWHVSSSYAAGAASLAVGALAECSAPPWLVCCCCDCVCRQGMLAGRVAQTRPRPSRQQQQQQARARPLGCSSQRPAAQVVSARLRPCPRPPRAAGWTLHAGRRLQSARPRSWLWAPTSAPP